MCGDVGGPQVKREALGARHPGLVNEHESLDALEKLNAIDRGEAEPRGARIQTRHVHLGPKQARLALRINVGLPANSKKKKKSTQNPNAAKHRSSTAPQRLGFESKNAHALERLQSIVQRRHCRIQQQRTVRPNHGRLPARLRVPVALEHVIGEGLAKHKLIRGQLGLGLVGELGLRSRGLLVKKRTR